MIRKELTAFCLAAMTVFAIEPTKPIYSNIVYSVQPGDTIWGISARTGTDIASILDANNLVNPDLIYIGDKLSIPPKLSADTVAVLNQAKSMIGNYKYVWGGSEPSDGGFDCSGFMHYIFGFGGEDLPHSAHMQAVLGQPVSESQIRPGDVIYFQNTYTQSYNPPVTHCGIYIGQNHMIMAEMKRDTILTTTMWGNPYWVQHFWGIRRFIPITGA